MYVTSMHEVITQRVESKLEAAVEKAKMLRRSNFVKIFYASCMPLDTFFEQSFNGALSEKLQHWLQ
jgi:hypothetical protein